MDEKLEQLSRVVLAEAERRRFPLDIGDAEIHELAVWLMKEHRELAIVALQNAIGHRLRN